MFNTYNIYVDDSKRQYSVGGKFSYHDLNYDNINDSIIMNSNMNDDVVDVVDVVVVVNDVFF